MEHNHSLYMNELELPCISSQNQSLPTENPYIEKSALQQKWRVPYPVTGKIQKVAGIDFSTWFCL